MSKSTITLNISDFICQNESMVQFDKDIVSDKFTNVNVNTDTSPQKNYFGVINLKIKKTNPITQKRHFVFSIDCSGSMNDLCNDGKTKNDHSNHTLINMITYFAEHPELMVSITVYAFDCSIYTIIENQDVTQENLDKLIQDIKKIRPKDMTNIEKALINSREYIVNYCTKNTDSNVTHIFMTDGDATQGNTIPSKLKEYVSSLVSNIFIGFGIEHNVYLLKELASDNKNNYYFVDALEKAGLVYGEILHSIIYRVLENTNISVVNGLIYDWKKNSWVDRIDIGDLVNESNKIIHVLSDNPSEFSCLLQCSLCGSKENFELSIQNMIKKTDVSYRDSVVDDDNDDKLDGFTELTKYKYRQRTQQLLYEANLHNFNNLKCKKPLKISPYHIDYYDDFCKIHYENGKILKAKMKDLLKEMQQFLDKPSQTLENVEKVENLEPKEPNLYKLLCDDIYICLHTFDTSHGAMYSCARQTSQGAQRSYSATYTPRVDKGNAFDNVNNVTSLINGCGPPRFMRSYAINSVSPSLSYPLPTFPDFTEDDINLKNFNADFYNQKDDSDNEEYTVSDQIDNPYSTLSILELMRSCSATVDESKKN